MLPVGDSYAVMASRMFCQQRWPKKAELSNAREWLDVSDFEPYPISRHHVIGNILPLIP